MLSGTSPAQPLSLVGYLSHLLGSYALLIPLAAIAAFIVTLAIVWRGRQPFAGATLQLVVPMPLLLSVVGMLHYEAHTIWTTIQQGDEGTIIWAEVGIGLVFPMLGLLGAAPSLFVATLGSLKRFGGGPGRSEIVHA